MPNGQWHNTWWLIIFIIIANLYPFSPLLSSSSLLALPGALLVALCPQHIICVNTYPAYSDFCSGQHHCLWEAFGLTPETLSWLRDTPVIQSPIVHQCNTIVYDEKPAMPSNSMQYYTMPNLRSVPRYRDSIFMIAVLPQVPRAVRPACRVLPCWGDHHAGYDDGDDDDDDDEDNVMETIMWWRWWRFMICQWWPYQQWW